MRWLALAALFAIAMVGALPAAEAQEPVTISIQGPSAIAPSSIHPYVIIVSGGPAELNGTFHIEYSLQGDNLEGGDPQVPRPQANREGRFDVNVTAPSAEGTIVLFVNARSEGEGGQGNETREARYVINVFRPVELRATLRNDGAAAALNVTVLFFVDNQLVGNASAARIDAGGEATVNITYIPVNLPPGRHTVRVQADLNGDGNIDAGRGELFAFDLFYKTQRTNTPAILGTITGFVLIVLFFVLLAIRRQRRLGG